jgi:sensor domain CHASE-containing protein
MMETIAKTGMGVLLAASVPLGGDSTLWAQWGLAGVVVGFTLWRDHSRERRMSSAIEKDHKWVRETLVNALERNTAALEKMTARFEERSKS